LTTLKATRWAAGQDFEPYRGTSLIRNSLPPQEPTEALRLGPCGSPVEVGAAFERGTPVELQKVAPSVDKRDLLLLYCKVALPEPKRREVLQTLNCKPSMQRCRGRGRRTGPRTGTSLGAGRASFGGKLALACFMRWQVRHALAATPSEPPFRSGSGSPSCFVGVFISDTISEPKPPTQRSRGRGRRTGPRTGTSLSASRPSSRHVLAHEKQPPPPGLP